MIEFTRTRISTAPIEAVFDVMTDHRRFADCSGMFRRSTIDQEGTPAPNGLGAIRRLTSYGTTFVEEIIDYQPPTRWAYELLSGAPTRDHVGTIELRQTDTGTWASWHLQTTLKIPGLGWLVRPAARWFIDQLLKDALTAAERRA